MRGIVFVILLLLLYFNCIGQTLSDNGLPAAVIQVDFTNKAEATNQLINGVKEGKWVEYFKIENNAEVETQSNHASFYRLTTYKSGKPFGIVKEFYKTGELWNTTLYTNDWATGVSKEFFMKGKLFLKDTITDNNGNGIVEAYYDSGRVETSFPFTIDGRGGVKIFIKSLQKKSGFLLRGTMNGDMKIYNEKSRKVQLDWPIKSDTNNIWGSSITIHNDKRFYLNISGRVNGTTKDYYESGQLRSEENALTSADSVRIIKDYYENGILESETPFIKGKLNGVDKHYDKDGKLDRETPYVDGKITGVVKHYYPNGKLRSEATFQQNELVGREAQYDELGKQIK